MLVARREMVGTIGGGHLELKAIDAARATSWRNDAGAEATELRFALGPSLGQCCGGAVKLALAPLDAAALARWPASAPLFTCSCTAPATWAARSPRLLATLDCASTGSTSATRSSRPRRNLGSPWPSHIRQISADTIEREVQRAPAGAFYLVLTHEHALDLRIAEAILRRGDFAFFGLIGSKTKRATFTRRFEERGIDPAAIARMTCPIGVPGIEGKAPEMLAAASSRSCFRNTAE